MFRVQSKEEIVRLSQKNNVLSFHLKKKRNISKIDCLLIKSKKPDENNSGKIRVKF